MRHLCIRFTVARPALDADVVISLPKVKTHVLTTLTCAVKNMYGVIPGYQKTRLHKEFPAPAQFGELLTEIVRLRPPDVTIADGVLGMDGDGPSAGSPRALGFMAASDHAVALDASLCRLLGMDPYSVPYLPRSGSSVFHFCEERGADAVRPRVPSFRKPTTALPRILPPWLVSACAGLLWVRPLVDSAVCSRCGACVRACPARAMRIEEPGRPPSLHSSSCLSCCCCHEVWPRRRNRPRSHGIAPNSSLAKEVDILRMTQATMDLFDRAIRQQPDQWFWYNRRWVLDPPPVEPAPKQEKT